MSVQCIKDLRSPPKTQKIFPLKLQIYHNQNILSKYFDSNSFPKMHMDGRLLTKLAQF